MTKKRIVDNQRVLGFDNLNYDETGSSGIELEFQEFGENNSSITNKNPQVNVKSCVFGCGFIQMAKSKFKEFFYGFRHIRKDLSLCNIRKVHYIKSDWESFENLDQVSPGYLVYRGLFLAVYIFIVTLSMYTWSKDELHYYFIYLTIWTIWLQLIYALLFFANVVHWAIKNCLIQRRLEQQVGKFNEIHVIHNPQLQSNLQEAISMTQSQAQDAELAYLELIENQPKSNCVEAIISFLFPIVSVLSLFVTLGYWSFVYTPTDPKIVIEYTIFTHGVNALFAIVDFFVVSLPVRATHCYYVGVLASIYSVFSRAYDTFDGTYPKPEEPYIYKALNWREHPKWTILYCIVGCLISIVIANILWFLYSFRLFIISSCIKAKKEVIYWVHKYDYSDKIPHFRVTCPNCGMNFHTCQSESCQKGHENPAYIEHTHHQHHHRQSDLPKDTLVMSADAIVPNVEEANKT